MKGGETMNTLESFKGPHERVNLFFPIVLVGAGVILLMANLGMLTRDPFFFALQFWPVFLIAGGIQLLFGRTRTLGTVVSVLLGLAVVGSAIYFLTLPGEAVTPTWWNWTWRR
jgi:hypothetical protein